ncbi:MAG: hypothetical protein R6X23_08315 [Acidimicrobiia bacterium]
MGMFKDIKKLSDQGKEISKASGRPTSMLGMIKQMPADIHNATEMVGEVQADMALQQKLLTSGKLGTGTITAIQDTGTLVNFNPQVIVDMQVAVEGQAPYAVQITASVPQIHIPLIQPGNTIGVRVDPDDPASVILDWSRPQG